MMEFRFILEDLHSVIAVHDINIDNATIKFMKKYHPGKEYTVKRIMLCQEEYAHIPGVLSLAWALDTREICYFDYGQKFLYVSAVVVPGIRQSYSFGIN